MSSKRPRGGLTKYTEAIAEEICDRLAAGESLASICRDPHMPNETKVRIWAMNDQADKQGTGAGFRARFNAAREMGYERMADEVIAIGDADYRMPDGLVDNAAVQQARLRSDNRKWMLSKMLPKRFGDRVTAEVVGDASAPLLTRIELVAVPPRVMVAVPPRVIDVTSDGSRNVANVAAHTDTQAEIRARSPLDVTNSADD
jgi:hypothetical protein